MQGLPQQPGIRQIAHLIVFSPLLFENENIKVKVKYSFILYTDLVGSHLVGT